MANGYSADDIAQLESRRAAYLQAESDILRNQEYQMPDRRRVMRAELVQVRAGLKDVTAELRIARGTTVAIGRARRGVQL